MQVRKTFFHAFYPKINLFSKKYEYFLNQTKTTENINNKKRGKTKCKFLPL